MLGSAPVNNDSSGGSGSSGAPAHPKLHLTKSMLATDGDSSTSSDVASPDKRRRTSASETPSISRFPTLDTKSATESGNVGKSPKAQVSGVVGPNNNSAGDSRPHPTRSTFRVGVTEDTNRKCRRTMEDTHSYLYNFLPPLPEKSADPSSSEELHSDDGYFAIFDGHAGTYAAEWCGKKLHLVLEDTIRKNPGKPIPDMLDATFTSCDGQLEKLPVKNSGCTAVTAVLRWEYRTTNGEISTPDDKTAERVRVLYTANVGDARIILSRSGKALRLSYDHKGSDENEGRRVANAGGLILNNRVNGVLAVTRALGDSYMKELVTGHPYTTETVLCKEDEFILLACDGLWDVCSDQEAVDLVRDIDDPQEASKRLVDHALERFSSDNLSCMIVRLDHNKKNQPEATETEKVPAKPEGNSKGTDEVTTEKVKGEGPVQQEKEKEKPPSAAAPVADGVTEEKEAGGVEGLILNSA